MSFVRFAGQWLALSFVIGLAVALVTVALTYLGVPGMWWTGTFAGLVLLCTIIPGSVVGFAIAERHIAR